MDTNNSSSLRPGFPEGGRDWDDLQQEMQLRRKDDLDWQKGRSPLFVFGIDQETYEIGKKAFFEFFSENALGQTRVFFSIQSMEQDVLNYGLSLFGAPASGKGVFTSGGSESILVGVKTAREAWRAGGKGRDIHTPVNIVMPITGHPAFDKAANLMNIEIRRAPLRPDYRVDVAEMAKLIDENTIAIVGSAPCFPHGVIDAIDELSDLAMDAGVWLHVDACVGGWIAPFFTRNGRPTPDFDFRYPGVRSISADLHKFGFCPKPASTVFFRDEEDVARAAFTADAWPSGAFTTSTLVGTRPGGAVASAWAVLNHLGESGYRQTAQRLADMVDGYVQGITAIDGLRMVVQPDVSIINVTSDEVNMFSVAREIVKEGWLIGLTRRPQGIHSMMSLYHEPVRDEFLALLSKSVETVRAGGEMAGSEGDVVY